jgi:6-phosphogluconate dehydrogenase
VDGVIEELTPLLDEGDIVIDAGNSHFPDTKRRTEECAAKGLRFMGVGVSGGEEGALNGPSIMPGGDPAAYAEVEEILTSIAAVVDDTPCCVHVGPDGAGHYVKMVHNGIEYADIQLIAEAYDLLTHVAGLDAPAIGKIFEDWNTGDLESFLIEITGKVLAKIWRGGCIIRARFLNRITEAYGERPDLVNLLMAPYFRDAVANAQDAWRRVVVAAVEQGIAVPAFSSSLAYYDGYRRERGPANLIQGQRDFFGAHTYRRVDKEGSFHTRWSQDGSEVRTDG